MSASSAHTGTGTLRSAARSFELCASNPCLSNIAINAALAIERSLEGQALPDDWVHFTRLKDGLNRLANAPSIDVPTHALYAGLYWNPRLQPRKTEEELRGKLRETQDQISAGMAAGAGRREKLKVQAFTHALARAAETVVFK